jgi:hypothetical protein
MRLGIVMKAHFGVPCGHIKPDGSILWPDERGEELNNVKVYIHRSFRYTLDGRSLRFKEGETYDFPEEEALEKSRAGFLSIIEDKPAVKVVVKPEKQATKAVK